MYFLRLLKAMLLLPFSIVDVAELRAYDWDGVFPKAWWHGWCDLFGHPYSVLFDAGEGVREGGWIDVHHLGRLPVTAKLTGTGVGVIGNVIVRFQGAMSLNDTVIRDTPTDMEFVAEVEGTTEVETSGVIDCQIWNYVRFHSVINNAGGAIVARFVTHDGVTPIDMPENTGV